MYRYKITIEYDGIQFEAGLQYQPNKISVQSVLEHAITNATQETARVYAASRTDKNVHALGQVVHINLNINHEPRKLFNSVNFYLRETGCRVIDVQHVDQNFHARYSSKNKTYRYCICHSKVCSVFDINRCWHIHNSVQIDLDLMIQASKSLVGEHDFSSFRDASCKAFTPIRSIKEINIYKKHDKIYFDFVAQSFLHKQIRIIVGTLFDIGRGHLHDIQSILNAKNRRVAGQTAPGYGLYLVQVVYDNI